MNGQKKLLFIINPASGNGTGKPGEDLIRRFFKDSPVLAETVFTNRQGHAKELAAQAVKEKFDGVVAVGGDGTVNEVAQSLNYTNCVLGILPCGSGNGLARHHHISLNVSKALTVIREFHAVPHDSVMINEHVSFNVSGIGFDAHVAHLFGNDGKRGFSNYLRLVFREFPHYQPHRITVHTNDIITDCPSTMLAAIANGTQFGNNARISPHSDTNDGLVDIITVKRMHAWQMPGFALKVFRGRVKKSTYATMLSAPEAMVTCEKPLPLHIDGEPAGFSTQFKIKSLRSSLKLIIPKPHV